MDADLNQPIQSVLMTADTVGGVWTYSLTLAKALRQHGVSVYLATMGAPVSRDQREQVRSLDNVFLFESQFRLEWMDNPWDDVRRAGDWLLNIEQNIDASIIHLNGYAHASLPWERPVVVVGHSCVLSWWRAVKHEEDAPKSWARYREAVRRGLMEADAVIAPSRAMLSELNRRYGPLRTAFVVPNACHSQEFTPATKEPFIFSSGRLWDEAKNVRALDAIAPALKWPVYLAGDGFAAQGSHLVGCLSAGEIRSWYSRASIYVLPARYEPFGLSILEAALSGCALVVGDIPSLRENWDDAAVFVDPDDPAGLREAIEGLIADDEIRAQLAARARARGLGFIPDRMARAYMDVYRSIAAAQVKTCA